jgi:hypothetical protein
MIRITTPKQHRISSKLAALGLCISALLGSNASHGQSIVANGNFETYNACPDFNGDIVYSSSFTSFPTVASWITPISTTPDYFHTCGSYPAQAPNHNFGYQQPHSGNGFVGMITHQGGMGPYLEYVSTKLVRPMVKDSIYNVIFFVSSAEGGNRTSGGIEAVIAVNEFGAHFSDTIPGTSTAVNLNLPYHIKNDTNKHLSDTSKWYEVSGSYRAKGGERWMTIGRFLNTAIPAYTLIKPGNGGNLFGYTLVDDVSVIPTSRANTGVVSTSGLRDVSIYPNPASTAVRLNGLEAIPGNKFITIRSMTGAVVNSYTTGNGKEDLDISMLPAGVYMLQVYTEWGGGTYRLVKAL